MRPGFKSYAWVYVATNIWHCVWNNLQCIGQSSMMAWVHNVLACSIIMVHYLYVGQHYMIMTASAFDVQHMTYMCLL